MKTRKASHPKHKSPKKATDMKKNEIILKKILRKNGCLFGTSFNLCLEKDEISSILIIPYQFVTEKHIFVVFVGFQYILD